MQAVVTDHALLPAACGLQQCTTRAQGSKHVTSATTAGRVIWCHDLGAPVTQHHPLRPALHGSYQLHPTGAAQLHASLDGATSADVVSRVTALQARAGLKEGRGGLRGGVSNVVVARAAAAIKGV